MSQKNISRLRRARQTRLKIREVGAVRLTVHRYSDWLLPEDKDQARTIAASVPFEAIQGYVRDGVVICEHAYAGALRFFASGSLEGVCLAGTLAGTPQATCVETAVRQTVKLTARAQPFSARHVVTFP